MTANNRTFKLLKITDIRPINLDTGKREPLDDYEKANVCDRCGRRHAVVWTVEETTSGQERFWHVGSTCGPKLLGWAPMKSTVKRLTKEARTRALREAWRPKVEEAIAYGRQIRETCGIRGDDLNASHARAGLAHEYVRQTKFSPTLASIAVRAARRELTVDEVYELDYYPWYD